MYVRWSKGLGDSDRIDPWRGHYRIAWRWRTDVHHYWCLTNIFPFSPSSPSCFSITLFRTFKDACCVFTSMHTQTDSYMHRDVKRLKCVTKKNFALTLTTIIYPSPLLPLFHSLFLFSLFFNRSPLSCLQRSESKKRFHDRKQRPWTWRFQLGEY